MSAKTNRGETLAKLVLIGVFLSVFALFVWKGAGLRSGLENFRPGAIDLALLVFATFRLGRLVAYDLVAEPLRRPFARTVPDATGAGDTVEPRGSGARLAFGQMVTCPICAGTWIAAVLVYGLYLFPGPARVFLVMTAAIGAAEMLHAFSEALCWSGQLARTLAGAKTARTIWPPAPGDSFGQEAKTNGSLARQEWKSN